MKALASAGFQQVSTRSQISNFYYPIPSLNQIKYCSSSFSTTRYSRAFPLSAIAASVSAGVNA